MKIEHLVKQNKPKTRYSSEVRGLEVGSNGSRKGKVPLTVISRPSADGGCLEMTHEVPG